MFWVVREDSLSVRSGILADTSCKAKMNGRTGKEKALCEWCSFGKGPVFKCRKSKENGCGESQEGWAGPTNTLRYSRMGVRGRAKLEGRIMLLELGRGFIFNT